MEKEKEECDRCGDDAEWYFGLSGNTWCDDCYNKYVGCYDKCDEDDECYECGELGDCIYVAYHGGRIWCEDCYDHFINKYSSRL